MFKELENLVYTEDEQIKKETATVEFKGLRINAKVASGKNLEEILSQDELVR